MPAVHRLLARSNNAAVNATVSASSVLPADNSVFRQTTTREGSGQVQLAGSYTGADDTTIEIEIRPTSTGAERVSSPVFAGAGNGAMSGETAGSGVAAQDLTVTLVDLGTATTPAQAILYADVLLYAQTAGAGGNSIELGLTVNLTRTVPPVGVLPADLKQGEREWSTQTMNFGAKPLNPDGTLPSDAPRLIVGGDTSQVYRHYKRWDGSEWQYGVSPSLAANYPKGSLVEVVTGDYTATVTQGATVETYPGLATLYDLLLALDASALIAASSPPANDQKPGGMAAVDMPFRASAFALPVVKGREGLPDLAGIVVATTAPTETVTVECIDAAMIGGESWEVHSAVAGTLPKAITGVAYTAGFVGFTVPIQSLSERPVIGRMAITQRQWADLEGRSYPDICLYRPVLGARAASRSLTLVWTQRPAESDCDCKNSRVSGAPREEFLGVNLGEEDMTALSAGYRARIEALQSWHKGFVASNTQVTAAGELRVASVDIQLADLGRDILADCLADLYTDGDAVLAESVWAASTAYAIDAAAEPATRNGYRYRVTVPGTSSGSEPTWPTTVGNTVTDGSVTWKCVSKIAESAWDDVLSGLSSDLTSLAAINSNTHTGLALLYNSTAYTAGDAVYGVHGGYMTYAICTTGGTTGTVNLGTADIPVGVELSTLYGIGSAKFTTVTLEEALAAQAAKNSTTDIDATSGLPITDPGITHSPTDFADRYQSACDAVRTIAGLLPKKSNARLTGSSVWRDLGTDYWVIEGSDYLPVFNNVYYHSCVIAHDPDTGAQSIVSTQEFGFALRVACEGSLVVGDTVTITIGDVEVRAPYQVGDTYEIPLIRGGPLAFAGGVTGTDTLTWTVHSSVLGALPSYLLTAGEPAYLYGGIGFQLNRGGIPFALGDQFTFSVETGGRYRWRQDGGPWSADTPIPVPASPDSLADGLTAAFLSGPAPSFVLGDIYEFEVRQPASPAHVLSGDATGWQWTGSSATLTLSFASDQTVSAVGLLRHALTAPATATVVLKNSGGSTLATVPLTVATGPLVAILDTPLTTVRSVEVTVANADSMALGWVYLGTPFQPSHNADVCTIKRVYALERGGGINPSSAYLGDGRGGELSWTSNWLVQDDLDALLPLIDACKANNDEPLVIIPNANHPEEAALCRLSGDEIELSDVFEFQPNAASRRRINLRLPFTAVVW